MMQKNRKTRQIIFLWASLALILHACGGETTGETQTGVDEMLTAAVGTLAASIQQTQTALAPTITSTSTATSTATVTSTSTPNLGPSLIPSATYPYYTATFAVLFTPSPTGTLFTPTVNPSSLAYGCNNLLLIRDVNYPNGTVVQPRENFTKIWKVANNGTCEWKYQYSLELLSANFPVSGSYKLSKIVAVNHWAELSMNFDAPKNPGTYTSYWRLTDGAGHMFGSTLGASFVVPSEPPTDVPAPTAIPTTETSEP